MMMPPPTPKSVEKSPADNPMTASLHQRADELSPAVAEGLLASVAMPSPIDDAETVLAPFRARVVETAVLIDLDGTIAPIRPRPEDVVLTPEARAALESLLSRACLVGLVSGRALADLERIVGVAGCAYAGNHGMEIRRPDGSREVAGPAEPHLATVQAFARAVDDDRLSAAGAWLEDKGVTLSFHFRTAPDQVAAERFLDAEIVPQAEAAGLRVTRGRKVVEVRPPIEVNKGTAVREIVRGSGCRLAVYLGDDTTDLDAWAALRGLAAEGAIERSAAIAVVGDETPDAVRGAADVTLNGVDGALQLLLWLAGEDGHAPSGSSGAATPS
jgi:trehalose 6-phosphate phosphatase